MVLPALPVENEDPWFPKRDAFDQAVKKAIETDLPASITDSAQSSVDTAKTYSDNQDNTILGAAKSYSDTQDAANLTSANNTSKTYTDSAIKTNESESVLASGTDLNTVLIPGRYFVPSVIAADATLHSPNIQAGHLEVVGYLSYLIQRYTTYNYNANQASCVYSRSYSNGAKTFSAWTKLSPDSENITDGVRSLDSLVIPGTFLLGASNNTVANGSPEAGSTGTLEVFQRQTPDSVGMQRYTSNNTGLIYTRYSTAAVGTWNAWRIVNGMNGIGSPLGKVIAPQPGIIYTDLAQTNGASQWISNGSNSTQTWAPLNADTGWRNVQDLMDPSLATAVARLRRFGPTCFLYIQAKTPDAGWVSGSTLLNSPGVGFRPPFQMYTASSYAQVGNVILQATGALNLYTIGAAATGRWTLSWMTSDVWPTALPGTAA